MAHEAGFMFNSIEHMWNVHSLCEKDPFTVGIWTDARVKVYYAIEARKHVRDGTLAVIDKLVCANPQCKDENDVLVTPERRADFMWNKLREQLMRYRQIENETTNPLQIQRSGISGVTDRHGKKDPSAKDDLALAFTFACGIVGNLRSKRVAAERYKNLQSNWLV